MIARWRKIYYWYGSIIDVKCVMKCKVCKTEIIHGNRCIDCYLAGASYKDTANKYGDMNMTQNKKLGIPDYCIIQSARVERHIKDIYSLGGNEAKSIPVQEELEVYFLIPPNQAYDRDTLIVHLTNNGYHSFESEIDTYTQTERWRIKGFGKNP